MPAESCFRRNPWRLCAPAAALSAALLLSACGGFKKAEGKGADDPAPAQSSLLTVSDGQLQRLHVEPARRRNWTTVIHSTGTVDWDADHTTQAITQVNGPVSRILVDLGSMVKAGEPLLYVSSPDVATAISTYRKARNREALAKRVSDRMNELLEHGAVARKDVESSDADYADAQTDVETSLQALKIFGITKEEIEGASRREGAIGAELAVRAPISGTVVQKLVSPGQVIQAGSTVCFELSDTSTVWVQGHVFDQDLARIQVGDPVEETNPSLGRSFHGAIAYIGASVDPATRTTPVRIVTRNPGGLLKKDMFVDAAIRTAGAQSFLAVPVAAVLRDEQNEPMVYVQAQPGQFAQRSVTTGPEQDGMVAITGGLREGERVVSEGSLFLQFASNIR